MNPLLQLASAPAWRDVVIVLLHTLWQAPLIALAAYGLLRMLPARRARTRYGVCVAALALVVIAAAGTWSVTTRTDNRNPTVPSAVASATNASASPVLVTTAAPGAAAATPAPGASPVAPTAAARERWSTLAAAAWCCGVVLMLARMLFLVAGARRLTRRAALLDDSRVLEMIDRLRRRLRIGRDVRVLVTQQLGSPAVVGILRPCIILPASLLSGVPADQLEAILLHELAHIRRWDYCVNLVQLFIEALLFFNPAVWWISRQIRAEREACCDAVAVGLTGRPLRYAEALADWMAAMRAPQAAMAMSGGGDQGGRQPTLDRVSRILLPGYRPRLRLSWPSLLAVLITGALLLAGVWRGTGAAVSLAAHILSPQQRMERLVAATQSAIPPHIRHSDKQADQVKISGTIRTADGKPLPKGGWINTHIRAAQHSTSSSLGAAQPSFNGTVPPGVLHMAITGVPGYAPKSVGPFTATPGGTLPPIGIVLERGFVGRLRLQDEAGRPLRDVSVDWSIDLPGGGNIHNIKSDAAGLLTFGNAIDGKYSVTAAVSGFEVEKREVRLKPDQTIDWALKRAAPVTGVVLDLAGNPIVGAKLAKFAELQGTQVHAQQWDGRDVLATTDAQGRFTLPSLRRDRTYVLLVTTPDKRRDLVQDVKAGQTDRRIQLATPRVIRGRVTGEIARLTKHKGKPTVSYSYTYKPTDHMSYGGVDTPVPVTVEDDAATFEIRDPLPLPVSIRAAGAETKTVDAARPPAEPVVLHVPEKLDPPKRDVIVRLTAEGDAPPPRGTVTLTSSHEAARQTSLEDTIDLKDGGVKFTAYAGGKLSVRFNNLIGCYVPARSFFGTEFDIPKGEGTHTIEIPTIPAGAITGTLTGPDGEPVPDDHTLITVHEVTKSPRLTGEQRFNFDSSNHPSAGRFMMTPLPLNGTYQLSASLGKNRVFSEPITIDEANPLKAVALKFPKGVEVKVRVIDPSGAPVPQAPVDFSYEGPFGSHGYSPTPVTDANGVIKFSDINPGVPGKYTVSVPMRAKFQPAKADVRLDGTPTVIQLQPGAPLKGRVILQPAGTPLAGAQVMANAPPYGAELRQFLAEAKTDEQGRFTFSNLAPGEYNVRADPPTWPGQPYQMPDAKAIAGQDAEVEVVIKLVGSARE